VPLPGGGTRTSKCLAAGEALFKSSSARADAAQLLVVITDGMPSNQIQTEAAAKSARDAGIVVLGVGVDVGSWGAPSIKKLTSNQCPANNAGCSAGLTGAPSCVTPCDDHYLDASSFNDLPTILDSLVSVACEQQPGCQYTWGAWSACSEPADPVATPPERTRAPVISYDDGNCPGPMSEPCKTAACKTKADFILLLDASGSMSNCDWASQAWFAREFVERLPYDKVINDFDLAQVGVVQFASAFVVRRLIVCLCFELGCFVCVI
jgi:hypothetical protein